MTGSRDVPLSPVAEFGDKDPEDAWDDGDPLPVRLRLLARIIEHIAANEDVRAAARRRGVARLAQKIADETADG